MIRIRYKKNPNGSLFAAKLKSPTEELYVNISDKMVNEIKYHSLTIFNLKGELQFTCMEKTLPAAKKEAKKALIELGVNFIPEIRPRTTKTNKEEVLKIYQESITEDLKS